MASKDTAMAQPLVEGRPEIMAQVRFAVKFELAERLCDVMIRRTQLFYRCESQGLSAIESISSEMAALLGWSEERRREELSLYRVEVERSRQWQTD